MSPRLLPPKSAPLAARVRAAMKGSDYETARALGIALGNKDGSIVSKWLNGNVKRITSPQHRQQLPALLGTPEDYFSDPPPSDRLEDISDEVTFLREWVTRAFDALGVAPGLQEEARRASGASGTP